MRSPMFLFLLPVFFVFHGYVEHFRSINFIDCIPLIGIYLAAALVLFLLSRLLLRNSIKAALLSTFILSFYFFFGALHDALREHNIVLHRYSILLPVFFLLTIALIIYLKKKQAFPKIPGFLNLLLLIYLVIDAGTLIYTTITPARSASAGSRKASDILYRPCDNCPKPDIYFLLFDGYNATVTLKDYYGYDNSALDSFLIKEDFHIQRQSRSNYFATMFSMASMFNMHYLKGLDPNKIRSDDFTDLFGPIRDNEFMRYLGSQGYTIVNNSIFDLAGNPSPIDQPFIPTRTKLITDRTLINYMVRDMGKWFERHFGDPTDQGNRVYKTNVRLLARTIEESSRQASTPRFVYCHLLMPHFPHLFDSLQHRRDAMEVAREVEDLHKEPYLHYLPYTNARIRELIGAIKRNTHGNAIIIFMSDHGFRYYPAEGADERTFFHNQNAIYVPDGNYHGFYDSISAVNEFRVFLNNRFGQQLPLLKDSTIFLKVHE